MSNPFEKRTLLWLVVVAGLSFAGALALSIFGGDLTPSASPGTNAYSRSAIGHAGLVELLRELDVPVVVSRHSSGERSRGGLLIVAEPVFGEDDQARRAAFEKMLTDADAALVVLPKWYGEPDPLRSGWIRDIAPLPQAEVESVLHVVGVPGGVVYARRAAILDTGELGPAPTLLAPQLIGEGVESIIGGAEGSLLGFVYFGDTPVWILSDPDLISNHGLRRGGNAELAVAIIDALREGRSVVFDETMHGFAREPSIWRSLFEFPLVLATGHAVLVLALLAWAVARRFGAPLPPSRPIEPGKGFLIRNTADLLRFGGHAGHALERYYRNVLVDVAEGLHAPGHLGPAARRAWLDRLAATRELSSLDRLERDVNAASSGAGSRHAVATAHRLYQWKQEMLRGSHQAANAE